MLRACGCRALRPAILASSPFSAIGGRRNGSGGRSGGTPSSDSHFKGVSADKGKWKAAISIGRKRKSLGTFADEEEAAAAYRRAAAQRDAQASDA